MNKMRRALVLLFLISLGLGASLGSAAADPVESDTFKFTWLGVPIGEVTLHYGRYEDPNRAFGFGPAVLPSTSVRTLERQPHALDDNEHEEQRPLEWYRLGALEGRTNGLVRWLKRYEGAYRTTLTPSGSRYEVTAMDQGVSEVRDIWFGATQSDIPTVLDFRDRSSTDPLQSLMGVDEGSVDPVRLMRLILKAIEAHNGCPAIPKAFRVFDGKRRYEARLSEQNWVNKLVLNAQADTNIALDSSIERGLPSATNGTTSPGESSATKNNAAGLRGERVLGRAAQDREVGDRDLRQRKLTDAEASIAQESEELMDQALPSFVSQTVECQLSLVAREGRKDRSGDSKLSEIKENGKPAPAEPWGHTAVDPIDPQKQRRLSNEIAASNRLEGSSVLQGTTLQGTTESRSSAREIEYEEGQQSSDLATQRGLFWPFNRQDLTVDFSVDLDGGGARFRSFLIRAPVGQIKGRRINNE